MFSRVIVLLLSILFFCSQLPAQWQKISTPSMESNPRAQVLTYAAGKLWYATQDSLWMTSDDGASWHVRSPEDSFAAIHTLTFLDENNGLMATKNITYQTFDGGLNWDTVYVHSDNCYALRFIQSPKEIVIGSNGLCHLMITTDGGLTWDSTDFKKDPTDKPWDSVKYNFNELKDIHTLPNGTVKVLLLQKGGNGSVIATTHDFGQTWKFSTGFDYDCFSFVLDECDSNTIYVVNEDALDPFDKTAMLYRSFDGGKAWQAPLTTRNLGYFTGCLALSPGGVVYVQTQTEGIIRSTNSGTFWVNIGGPNGVPDTRLVAAVTDDLVYAADSKGRIWMTGNAGGAPGGNTSRTRLGLSKPMLFASRTGNICGDTLIDTLILSYPECPEILLSNVFVEGSITDYTILWRSGDTIVVRFIPQLAGKRFAELVLLLNGGTKQLIPLLGSGTIPDFSIQSSVPTLFAQDSVLFCDTIVRGLRVKTDGCLIPDVTTQTISGNARSDYFVVQQLPSVLTGDDSVTIGFAPKVSGSRPATLTIRFANNKVYTVPLEGFGIDPGPNLTTSKAELFSFDTVALCTTLRDTFILRSDVCKPRFLAWQQIIGMNKDEYTLERFAPFTFTGYDTIVISFSPQSTGRRNAEFHLVSTDSSRIVIPLSGDGIESPYTLSTSVSSLFAGDSVSLCDSIVREFVIQTAGCIIPDILTEVLNAPSDYRLLSALPSQFSGYDTIRISFAPTSTGLRSGAYELTLDDGRVVSIPLQGIGGEAPYAISVTPPSLFDLDSIFSCEVVEASVTISKTGCATVTVTSASCTGDAVADYSIGALTDSLTKESILKIRFQPTTFGKRNAVYTVVLDNGKVISIPLNGYGKPALPLTLHTQAEFITDTIGDDIRVPIIIGGLDKARTVQLSMNFDKINLVYKGSKSLRGISLDVPGSTTTTSSQLLIPASEVQLSGLTGYADFLVFADSAIRSDVLFGSLTVVDSVAACYYLTGTSATSSITGPAGCEIQEISNYLRYTKKPDFRIYPNPSTGKITIVPGTLVYADITIVDAMGCVRQRQQVALSKALPTSIDLSSLPSGLYFIRIADETFQAVMPVVLEN